MPARKLMESEVSVKSDASRLLATLTSNAVRSELKPLTRSLAVVGVRHLTGGPGGPPGGGGGGLPGFGGLGGAGGPG